MRLNFQTIIQFFKQFSFENNFKFSAVLKKTAINMLASIKKLLVTFLVVMLIATACRAGGEDDKNDEAARVKRGYGHGGGGGGHGHGPGKGGGASGPIYFCGYVGKTEGYGGYGK